MNNERPRFHLTAPAGPCHAFISNDQVQSLQGLLQIIDQTLEGRFKLTANEPLFLATEHEIDGGRTDDQRRADDIEEALADPNTVAILALRGGAWLTRVLPRINFDVLNERSTPVIVKGFSEITSLVNIVAGYDMGVGIYGNSPAFLPYGLRHHTRRQQAQMEADNVSPREWAKRHLIPEFKACITDLVSMVDRSDTIFNVSAELVSGSLEHGQEASFVGGNLTVFPALLGSMFRDRVPLEGHWLLLEDYNDRVSRLDRLLAHFTLDRAWDRCEGILLGDFHCELDDQTDAILNCLRNHLPAEWNKPILRTKDIGHIYPMIPLPLQCPVRLQLHENDKVSLCWKAHQLSATQPAGS
ncbi:MAG: LD-carboxypeptidase [Phycisphaerae bacterium]